MGRPAGVRPGRPRRSRWSGRRTWPCTMVARRHRRQGCFSRSYTLWCSWYSPGLPLRSTYCSSARVEPPYLMASCRVSTSERYSRRISWVDSESVVAVVAQAGGEQDLVGVDVADAGDDRLVHEERLELHRVVPAAAGRTSVHDIGSLDRVDAERRPARATSSVSSSGVATNISPNVRGSTKRSWPPWVKVMTTWVCLVDRVLGRAPAGAGRSCAGG